MLTTIKVVVVSIKLSFCIHLILFHRTFDKGKTTEKSGRMHLF